MNPSFTPVPPDQVTAGAVFAGLAILVILCSGLVLDIRMMRRFRRDGIPPPAYADLLLSRHWHWMDALWLTLVMSVFIGALLLVGQLTKPFTDNLEPAAVRIVIIVQNLVTQGLALGLVLYLQRRSGTTLAMSLGGPPAPLSTRLRQAFMAYLAAMPFIAVAAMVSNALALVSDMPSAPQPILAGFIDTTAPLWFKGWLVITAVAAAPLVEEVVFRGVFFPAIARHRGIPGGIVLGSMLFAMIHGHIPAVLPLFVVGTTLSLAYLYTGSLIVPIFIHAMFNTVNLTTLMLSGITYTP